MADNFASFMRSWNMPGRRHGLVTPSDTVDLDPRPRALRILTSGALVVTDGGGVDVTYTVTAGETFMFSPVRVKASGTTATAAWWE